MDEPTTALDVTTQIEVLRAFKKVVRERGTTALYVSHDLAVVAQIADRIVVLRDGEMQEMARPPQLLDAPARPLYASAACRGRSRPCGRPPSRRRPPLPRRLLQMSGLVRGIGGLSRTGLPRVPVLRDLDFAISRGSVLGVIGESGCGKSTLARVIAGLLAGRRGAVRLDGEPLPARCRDRTRDQLRRIQIVFQIGRYGAGTRATRSADILGRPLAFYHASWRGAAPAGRRMLDMVHLSAAWQYRYPQSCPAARSTASTWHARSLPNPA